MQSDPKEQSTSNHSKPNGYMIKNDQRTIDDDRHELPKLLSSWSMSPCSTESSDANDQNNTSGSCETETTREVEQDWLSLSPIYREQMMAQPNQSSRSDNLPTSSNSTLTSADKKIQVAYDDDNLDDTNNFQTADDIKHKAILDCLNENDRFIDLWKLRELAFTKGGYLNSSIRKLVWPILIQIHVDAFESTRPLPTTVLSPTAVSPDDANSSFHLSDEDLYWLMREVKKQLRGSTGWKRREDVDSSDVLPKWIQSAMTVPSLSGIEKNEASLPRRGSNDSCSTSSTLSTFATFISLDRTSEKEKEIFKIRSRAIVNIISTLLQQKPPVRRDTNNEMMTTVKKDTTTFEWKRSATANCGIAVNNTTSTRSETYRYFPGIVHLTDLFVTNLESPSLATLMICKLAKQHFRDALRGSANNSKPSALETSVLLLFLPLLRTLDESTYYELVVHSCQNHPNGLIFGLQTLCKVLALCMSDWFCNAIDFVDIDNAKIISRLADVFLVSHALMPLYLAVAIVSTKRKHEYVKQQQNSNPSFYSNDKESRGSHDVRQLLLCTWPKDEDLENRFHHLFQLNSSIVSCKDSTNKALSHTVEEAIEELVSTALSFVERVPPKNAVSMARSQTNPLNFSKSPRKSNVGEWSHLQLFDYEPPTWSTANTTPTQHGLFRKHATSSKKWLSSTMVTKFSDHVDSSYLSYFSTTRKQQYCKCARVAVGVPTTSTDSQLLFKYNLLPIIFLIVLVPVIGLLWSFYHAFIMATIPYQLNDFKAELDFRSRTSAFDTTTAWSYRETANVPMLTATTPRGEAFSSVNLKATFSECCKTRRFPNNIARTCIGTTNETCRFRKECVDTTVTKERPMKNIHLMMEIVTPEVNHSTDHGMVITKTKFTGDVQSVVNNDYLNASLAVINVFVQQDKPWQPVTLVRHNLTNFPRLLAQRMRCLTNAWNHFLFLVRSFSSSLVARVVPQQPSSTSSSTTQHQQHIRNIKLSVYHFIEN